MKKNRVLQLNKLYYPKIGGIENVVKDIAEGLDREANYEMGVLACQEKGRTKKEVINGVKVKKSLSLGVYWSMPIAPFFPAHLIKESKHYDILHFHFPFPIADLSYLLLNWTSIVKNKKVVVTWHSDIVRQKKVLKFYKPFLDKFLSLVDVIIVGSPNLIEHSEQLIGFKEKCIVIPFGIDKSKLIDVDEKTLEKYKLKYNKSVLFVGRLCYYKGVEYLMESFKDIDANLIIIGDGDLRDKLKNLCKQMDISDKVFFVGHCSQEELNFWYDYTDLFVLPSVESSEAFGLVQAEAMLFGKPVINTNLTTGVPFVSVDGSTGLTVEPKNTSELNQAIKKLLNNELLLRKYGENAKKRAEELFTREVFLTNIKKLYENLNS